MLRAHELVGLRSQVAARGTSSLTNKRGDVQSKAAVLYSALNVRLVGLVQQAVSTQAPGAQSARPKHPSPSIALVCSPSAGAALWTDLDQDDGRAVAAVGPRPAQLARAHHAPCPPWSLHEP